ncbi:MAG: fructosamine kinase family protein [Woeseiaceae bacterium]
MPHWKAIAATCSKLGIEVTLPVEAHAVGGGDISAAWRIDTDNGPAFIKTARVSAFDMFEAEADGLVELAAPGAIRVPRVLCCGRTEHEAFLALEWVFFSRPDAAAEKRLGEQLAQMHRHTAERFGWHRDNTIGLTPQQNARTADWIEFFRERRLLFQLSLANEHGYPGELQKLGQALALRLPSLFGGHKPVASLLHGDLWGGNWGSANGVPVIFDPAVYYGDRESDIAMTTLFGGFGRSFYEAYESGWPMAEGHAKRLKLYQLYHVLNHLNLFGRSYLERAIGLMRELLD